MGKTASQIRERRLFVISNNTHYLNVRNYIKTHGDKENHVIYICKYPKGYKKFIHDLKSDSSVKLVKVIFHKQNSNFPYNYLFLFKLILSVKLFAIIKHNYDTIFFSNYLSWIQHFIVKHFEARQYGLINDGTAIFKTVNLRKKTSSIGFPKLNPALSRYLGVFKIDQLHFYSPINIEVANGDTLELFTFKASATMSVDPKKIYFVGSDLVELGFVDLDSHLTYLKRIKKIYEGHQISYFAHRGEKDDFLENYKFFGTIIRDTIPFEERMQYENELPFIVISYASSILINLPQVYPQVKFYYYPISNNSINQISAFSTSYKTLIAHLESAKVLNLETEIYNKHK
jgi:hypothetical protein